MARLRVNGYSRPIPIDDLWGLQQWSPFSWRGRTVQNFGWGGDHVGKLRALQAAIKHLCGAGKVRERFDAGTFSLVTYHERDFPEHLRPAVNRIMDLRIKSRDEITPKHVVFALKRDFYRSLASQHASMFR